MKRNHNIIDVTVIVKHETEKAYLVKNLKGDYHETDFKQFCEENK